MMDFMFGSKDYPLDALWIERNTPLTIDGSDTYEGAVPFKYRKTKSTSQKEQVVNGLKMITYLTSIRTKAEIQFKPKDKIKIGNKVYSIKLADQVESELYDNARIVFKHFQNYETELTLE